MILTCSTLHVTVEIKLKKSIKQISNSTGLFVRVFKQVNNLMNRGLIMSLSSNSSNFTGVAVFAVY